MLELTAPRDSGEGWMESERTCAVLMPKQVYKNNNQIGETDFYLIHLVKKKLFFQL